MEMKYACDVHLEKLVVWEQHFRSYTTLMIFVYDESSFLWLNFTFKENLSKIWRQVSI